MKNMQARLLHGSLNFNDQVIIFGGASGYLQSSGTYNDVWKFDFVKKFHRMTTLGSSPSPRADFGFLKAGDKIFTVGGRSSNNVDLFMTSQNPFEVYMLSPKTGAWQKIITTGNEPQYSNGARGVMLSSTELLAVTGLLPMSHNWMQEVQQEGNYENLRTSMQVSVLKFTDSSMRGQWFRIADWYQNRRGLPTPRGKCHLVSLGSDNILMIGGCSANQILQDAWIMKITRSPTYNLKWIQVTIENPLVPSLPLNLFPSCLIGDLLVFTGVRTIMKKPGIEKPQKEPKKQSQEPSNSAPSPSTSQTERRTPIYINLERPVNTIGAMAAFSVSSQPAVPPQKVLKIQMSPEPSPEPPRRLQDYPMRVFCLDLSCIINGIDETFRNNPMIRWLEMKNGGLFDNAPELRAHGTLTQFENGIALIGGVRRSQSDEDVLFRQATNEVYILDYVHYET